MGIGIGTIIAIYIILTIGKMFLKITDMNTLR